MRGDASVSQYNIVIVVIYNVAIIRPTLPKNVGSDAVINLYNRNVVQSCELHTKTIMNL